MDTENLITEQNKPKRSRMKTALLIILSIFIIILIGAMITAATAFMPKYLESSDMIYSVDYGSPFPFLNQSTTLIINAGYFPRYFAPQYFHPDFDTIFYADMMIYSLLVNTGITAVAFIGIYLLNKLYRKNHPKKKREKKKKDEYRPVFD